MICRRCQGFMVVEPRYVTTESDSSGLVSHRRCLNCGNVEDPRICLRRQDARSSRLAVRDRLGEEVNFELGES